MEVKHSKRLTTAGLCISLPIKERSCRAGFGRLEVPFELLYAGRMSDFRSRKASTKRVVAKVQVTVESRRVGQCVTTCKGGAKQFSLPRL